MDIAHRYTGDVLHTGSKTASWCNVKLGRMWYAWWREELPYEEPLESQSEARQRIGRFQ